MTLLLIALGLLVIAVGLAGLVLPALPGSPLVFLGIVLVAWAEGFTKIGVATLVFLGVLAVLGFAVDYVAGMFGDKKMGATRWGVLGAALGMLVGIFFVTRRNLALLSIPCLLVMMLILTNGFHHLACSAFNFDGATITPLHGKAFWFLVPYAYILLLVDLIVLGWLFVRSAQNRWPVVLIFMGQIVSRGVFLLERAHILQSDLPLEMFWIAFEFLMYAIALFGFRMLDPIPMACRTAIEQLHAGMLVLDPQGRVTSLNPAAQAILGLPAKRALGRPIQDLLPMVPDADEDCLIAERDPFEIRLPEGHSLGRTSGTCVGSTANSWPRRSAPRILVSSRCAGSGLDHAHCGSRAVAQRQPTVRQSLLSTKLVS